MMLTGLANALRKHGLQVAEHPGWQQAGRDVMKAAGGVLCHHTAGPTGSNAGSLEVVINGRNGLAGPLANLHLSRRGLFTAVAAGKANHAGVVIAERFDSWHMIGIEAENDGIPPLDWPREQMEAYATGCAALSIEYGFDVAMVRGHKEVAAPLGRKPDPDFDMSTFRAMVADEVRRLRGGGGQPSPAPGPSKNWTEIIVDTLPVLKRGSNGTAVRRLQGLLVANGQSVKVDGDFGPRTESAVKSEQSQAHIAVDGVVGKTTWTKLLGV